MNEPKNFLTGLKCLKIWSGNAVFLPSRDFSRIRSHTTRDSKMIEIRLSVAASHRPRHTTCWIDIDQTWQTLVRCRVGDPKLALRPRLRPRLLTFTIYFFPLDWSCQIAFEDPLNCENSISFLWHSKSREIAQDHPMFQKGFRPFNQKRPFQRMEWRGEIGIAYIIQSFFAWQTLKLGRENEFNPVLCQRVLRNAEECPHL